MLSVLKGDCLEVMKTLPAKSVDCFVCDLPYGCLTNQKNKDGSDGKSKGGKHHAAEAMGCMWDIKIDLDAFWEQVKRLARNDNTPVLMFCNTKFGADLINSNPKWFRYDLVWAKTNGVGFLSANKMPLRSHEMIYVFSKKGAYYKRVDILGDFPETAPSGRGNAGGRVYAINPTRLENGSREGIRCVKSVVEVANKKGRGNHPTQKPAELYEWLLARYCPEGGTMLDPTAGSFNSCWVAKKMGLKAIGIEKDPDFFWKAAGRAAE